MKIRRPGRTLVITWAVFIALLAVGLGFVVGDSAAGLVLVIVGAVGNVVTGWYIFATIPRTER